MSESNVSGEPAVARSSPVALPHTATERGRGGLAGLRDRVAAHTFDAFQYRNYRFLWASALGVGGGYWLQQVVVGWLIYEITRSAFFTSIALGLEAVPLLIAGPIGGFLVDVFDRRKLLIGIYLYQGSLALALGLGVVLWEVGPLEIFTFALLVGFSWVVSEPARAAIIANTVPKKGLMNAFALVTLGWGGTRLVVPAAGGVLIAAYGPEAALVTQAALMYTAAVAASMIRLQDDSREKPQLSEVINGLLEGARYVRDNTVVLGLLTFGLTPALIVFPFVYGLIPVYAAEIFQVGPTGLGVLMSASGIGMVVGTMVVASLGDFRAKGKLVIGAVAMAVVVMAAFSRMTWFLGGFGMLVLLSLFMPLVYTTVQAVVQGIIPDRLRGRISGFAMVTWGAFPMGSLLAGALAERFGVQTSTLIGAGLLGVLLTAQVLTFRFMWRLE